MRTYIIAMPTAPTPPTQIIDMLQKSPESRPSASELHTTRLPPLIEKEDDPVITQEEVGALTTARWGQRTRHYIIQWNPS